MRVLVIEDEDPLRRQLVTAIEGEGFIVESSGNGREGHYLGEEYPVDVAVVDIGLPEMSGIDIIKQWRKSAKQFPILILTARGRWQEKVEGLEAGADDYMVKPFDIEELLARSDNETAAWAQPSHGNARAARIRERFQSRSMDIRLTSKGSTTGSR